MIFVDMVMVGLGYGSEFGLTSLTLNLIGCLSLLTFQMKLDGRTSLSNPSETCAFVYIPKRHKRAPRLPPLTTIPVLSLSVRRAAVQPFPKPRLQHPFVTSYSSTNSLVCGAFTSPNFSNACNSMGRASKCSKTPSMGRCSNNCWRQKTCVCEDIS